MARNIISASVYVEKGGVGKTTSTAHILSAAALEHDLDVVGIDLAGTQNDLAAHYGLYDELGFRVDADGDLVADEIDVPISGVFADEWEILRNSIDNLVERMTFATDEGVDVIPSDPALSAKNNNLADLPLERRFGLLDEFIEEDLAPHYDLVVMDLPGNENNIVLNGLFAAEDTVAPLKPGEFEKNQLQSLDQDLQAISKGGKHDVNPELIQVFGTLIDRREAESRDFVEFLEETYPDLVSPPIPKTANIGHMQQQGQTLFVADDDELYDSGKDAREAYRQVARDLIERLGVDA